MTVGLHDAAILTRLLGDLAAPKRMYPDLVYTIGTLTPFVQNPSRSQSGRRSTTFSGRGIGTANHFRARSTS